MGYPAEYRYTKEHEWVDLDGTRAKVGKHRSAWSWLVGHDRSERSEPGRFTS